MRRILVAIAVASLSMAVLAGPATTDEPLPEHPHVLGLGIVVEGEELVAIRKCVDLAANQALPLWAQHAHMHFGRAGEALFVKAGNGVAPTAPFPGVPWTDCESLLDFFGL